MEPQALERLVDGFPNLSMGIIGDFGVDIREEGVRTRDDPERQGKQVWTVTLREILPGLAGNVAKNVTTYGMSADLYGLKSDDDEAVFFKRAYSHVSDGKKHWQHQSVNEGGRTITKKRTYDHVTKRRIEEHDRFDTDPPEGAQITALNEIRIMQDLMPVIERRDYSAILIPDYNKLVAKGDQLMPKVISAANSFRIPTFVDPKPDNVKRGLYKDAFVMTPNLKEAREIAGDTGDLEIEDLIRKVHDVGGTRYTIVTAGRNGAYLYDGETIYHQPSFPTVNRGLIDVTGAGDTFLVSLSATVSSKPVIHHQNGINHNPIDIMREGMWIATTAAGMAVEHSDTVSITRDQLKERGIERYNAELSEAA